MTASKKIRKFCIFTSQRSGSSWLVSLLNSHPEIKTFHEVFLQKPSIEKILPQFHIYRQANPGRRPMATFQYLKLLDSYPGDYSTIGYKVMYNQLIRCPELLIAFAKDRYRMIHLVRENHLDRYISNASMEQNGLVHSKVNVEAKPVTLDTEKLLEFLSWQEKQVKLARGILALLPTPTLEITYKDLTENNDQTMNKVASFLGVDVPDDHEFTSRRKKLVTGDYRAKLTNYDNVVACLAETQFAEFIREPAVKPENQGPGVVRKKQKKKEKDLETTM